MTKIPNFATISWTRPQATSPTSDTAAWTLLGLTFSLLAALNLAIFRHLRRAYAPPRARRAAPR